MTIDATIDGGFPRDALRGGGARGLLHGALLLSLLMPAFAQAEISGRAVSVAASSEHVRVADTLYFRADDGVSGRELWKTDGTPAGTVRVRDINPGPADAAPGYLTAVDGVLYFSAEDDASGRELWRSDGTTSGTMRVKDIRRGQGGADPVFLIAVAGILYFQADDGVTGRELWRTDGTASGTVLVKDINPGPASATPIQLRVVDGALHFTADDGVSGRQWWRTNGTAAGTIPLASDAPADYAGRDGTRGEAGSAPLVHASYRAAAYPEGVRGPWGTP